MKVALITGGSRGIGFGIAQALAREGWSLALCGRRPEADGALNALRGLGAPEVRYYQADLAMPEARRMLVEALGRDFPRLDALVNNAGQAPEQRVDLLDGREDAFERLLRANLVGPHFLTQQLVKRMRVQTPDAQGLRGRVLFITSISAEAASPERGDYCISKAGLSMSARLFAVRLAGESIPVWELRPGIIRTDMTAGVVERYDALLKGGLALERRWGLPEDVGRVAAALLRGDLPYAPGAVIPVDGGMLVPRL